MIVSVMNRARVATARSSAMLFADFVLEHVAQPVPRGALAPRRSNASKQHLAQPDSSDITESSGRRRSCTTACIQPQPQS